MTVFVLGLLVALLSADHASAQNLPQEFRTAYAQREEARAKRDRATFERLTTEDFVVVDPAGRIGDKKERAERLARAGGPGPFIAAQRMNERTAIYNADTIVLFWQQKAPSGVENTTEIWVKDAGQWKCAAAHVSPATAAGQQR